MKRMIGSAFIVAALGGAAVVLSAQARDGEPATTRELVNEIRALRAVIERFAEAQTQTQTIASLMTVQQRQMAEATTRLDIVRRELDAMTDSLQRRVPPDGRRRPDDAKGYDWPRWQAPPIDARQRSRSIGRSSGTNSKGISAKLGQLRARESEILNQVAFEEGRWRELTSRMEEWLKR